MFAAVALTSVLGLTLMRSDPQRSPA
jgi:hypothetical protein